MFEETLRTKKKQKGKKKSEEKKVAADRALRRLKALRTGHDGGRRRGLRVYFSWEGESSGVNFLETLEPVVS